MYGNSIQGIEPWTGRGHGEAGALDLDMLGELSNMSRSRAPASEYRGWRSGDMLGELSNLITSNPRSSTISSCVRSCILFAATPSSKVTKNLSSCILGYAGRNQTESLVP